MTRRETAPPIRVLLLEDNAADAELVAISLRHAGIAADIASVDTRAGFEAQLERGPDVILSDYQLPAWDGLQALRLVRGRGLDTPFILVSGEIGEDIAVEVMRDGADDYLLKDRLSRLGGAVKQALERKRLRDGQLRSGGALRRFRAAMDISGDGVLLIDRETMKYVDVNQTLCELTGYRREEIIGMTPMDLFSARREQLEREYDALIADNRSSAGKTEGFYRRKDGSTFPIETRRQAMQAEGRWIIVGTARDITERKRAEHELERFRLAMDATPDSIYLTDPAKMCFVYVNDAACRRLGYSREQLLALGPAHVLAKDPLQLRQEYEELFAAGEAGIRREGTLVRKDGTTRWTELHRRAVQTDSGPLVVSIGRDITERKLADDRIRRLNRVYAVLSKINSAIVRIKGRTELLTEVCRVAVDAGGFEFAWAGLVDAASGSLVPSTSAGDDQGLLALAPFRTESATGDGSFFAQAIRTQSAVFCNDVEREGRQLRYRNALLERGFRAAAGLPFVVDGKAVAFVAIYAGQAGVFDEGEARLLRELAVDISFALTNIAKEEQLNYLALYDSLTGLANRTLFLERVNQCIQSSRLVGGKSAVVFADVERLRTINESLGRRAGDDALRQIAGRLADAFGKAALARAGADHFAILLEDVKGRSEATRRVEGLWRDALGEPFEVAGTELRISARAGVSLFPNDAGDAESLLRNAEAALAKAKELAERYVFYAAEMTARTGDQLTLENQLRQALANGEFVLHYQPKVELRSRTIVGVEALIRWQSAEFGLVPPGKFIPLMEETGLILDVGTWALGRAVEDLMAWRRLGLKAPRVAVNVSSIQLRRREFVSTLEAALKLGEPPVGLDLEITESLIMHDVEGTIEKLKAARALGVQVAIDDFGTGYSSLGYLARLPVEALKIDRSFIIRMLDDTNTMTLVQTMITLGQSLRLKVVAEGVETEEQARVLRLLRCDEMQGYLFSKPVPFDALTGLLRSRAL